MLIVQLLMLIITLILIIRYGSEIRQKIKEKWRFIRLVNQLPGPTLLEMLGEVLRFKMDSEQFTYQMEAIFRKYAYQNDHGIVCFWFGLRPMLFLARSTSAKVIFENTKLTSKSDDYDIFKRLVGDGLLSA
ncbi:unnamed protein product [Brugia timori]|uniref:Cytochrome P450 n=1 Tax=Brugia timori TaxID=42155 RepID=A0A0R3Q8M8_9BILA|nr:unnamed protein product [Brugia timori]